MLSVYKHENLLTPAQKEEKVAGMSNSWYIKNEKTKQICPGESHATSYCMPR